MITHNTSLLRYCDETYSIEDKKVKKLIKNFINLFLIDLINKLILKCRKKFPNHL